MKAGRRRERVTLQHPDQVDNGKGGRKPNPETGGWIDIPDLYAEVIALRGDESIRSTIERAKQLWRVTIRWRPDVDPSSRLVWGATTMNITSLARSTDRADLVMTCESGVTGL